MAEQNYRSLHSARQSDRLAPGERTRSAKPNAVMDVTRLGEFLGRYSPRNGVEGGCGCGYSRGGDSLRDRLWTCGVLNER